MGKKVLITSGPLVRAAAAGNNSLQDAFDLLRENGFEWTLMNKPDSEYRVEDFVEVMKGTQAVIAGGEPWGEELFDVCPDLKILARFGAGYDKVDVAKATERGIMVTNARVFELSNGVAELAVGMAIASFRELANGCEDLRSGLFKGRSTRQLLGKTVGIIGFGNIGRRIAELLAAFKVHLLCHDPFIDADAAAKLSAEPVAFDRLLAESDIVFLCAPSTPENYHLFNAATFAKMKKGATFINVARGKMMDEKALVNALVSGHLAGAALDVWEIEPVSPDNPLLKLKNVLPLPHLAGDTGEGSAAIAKCCARQVVDALSGKIPQYLINP